MNVFYKCIIEWFCISFSVKEGRICLVAGKEYMTQIIYLYYAIEINVARI